MSLPACRCSMDRTSPMDRGRRISQAANAAHFLRFSFRRGGPGTGPDGSTDVSMDRLALKTLGGRTSDPAFARKAVAERGTPTRFSIYIRQERYASSGRTEGE